MHVARTVLLSSDLSHTAVNAEFDPGDISAVIGSKEKRCLAKIVGRSNPGEWDGCNSRGYLVISQELRKTRCCRVPGAQHVDPDAAILEIRSPGTGKGTHGRL